MLTVYSFVKNISNSSLFFQKISLFIWYFYLVINELKREIEYSFYLQRITILFCNSYIKRDWDKSPSISIVFGLSSKTQWLSGLYYADFISFYSPTQLCGGGPTKSNSNELPISVPLSFLIYSRFPISSFELLECRLRFHGCSHGGRRLFHPSSLQMRLLLLQELH